MDYVTTLLVEADPQIAWGISRVIEASGFPRPEHVRNGADAIARVTSGTFNLCLVDYDLPDMNGVDLTVLLRQRKPGLPIYLLSAAGSEARAIAAFRAGVSDYLPKDNQLFDSVVRAVLTISSADAKIATLSPTHSIPEGMPRELLNPTYQNRLRVIGRQIDVNRYRLVSIFEVDGGFLLRSISERGRIADALEFADRDFPHWATEAYRNRGSGERPVSMSKLLPTGYEDFLRAIGAALDRHQAEAVTVAEFASVIVVGGSAKLDTPANTTVGNLQWILEQDDIKQVLDAGYRQRKRAQTQQTGSVLDRIFGRQAQTQAATA